MFSSKVFLPNLASLLRSVRVSTTPRLLSSELFVHRDDKFNNENTPFEFTEANMKRIAGLIKNYPVGAQRSALGPMIDLVQRQIGWVPISAMHMIATILKIPRMRVYEWATFYTMTKRKFKGKYHVKVCVTTPCMLRGSDYILKAVEDATCCREGELSPDSMFGVETVQCAGACVNAPVMIVDDDYYEDLTCNDVYSIINQIRCGCIPNPGPQNGRTSCEPCWGQTSLWEMPPLPGSFVQPALMQPAEYTPPNTPKAPQK